MSNFGIMRASIAEVAVDQLQKRIRKQKKRKKRNLLRKVKTIVEDQVVHPAILFQAENLLNKKHLVKHYQLKIVIK